MVTCNETETVFETRCPGVEAVFLKLRPAWGGRTRWYAMCETSPGRWRLSLALPSGQYRYCYYMRDGASLLYHAPGDWRSVSGGFEALADVSAAARYVRPAPPAARPA